MTQISSDGSVEHTGIRTYSDRDYFSGEQDVILVDCDLIAVWIENIPLMSLENKFWAKLLPVSRAAPESCGNFIWIGISDFY